jgi:hypothetical protein
VSAPDIASLSMADQSLNKDGIIEFGGFEVVYVSGERGPADLEAGAPAAFDALEARLPTLKMKKFYGVVIDGAYRACVAMDDDTRTLDLPRWVIPSGRYAVGKIADWERHRDAIGPSVAALRSRSDFDAARPLIEYYRSQSQLRLLAPVA